MKLNFKKLNGFYQRFPRGIMFIPSKVKNLSKRKQIRKEDLTFFKEVKETKALFREEGFPERIINNVPSLIKRYHRIKPTLDRLADNGLH